MFKTIILLCHFLGITIAGHRDYFNEVPYTTGSGNVKTVHYTNTAPVTISYSSSIRPSLHKKSFYYFSAPDEHFEQRHSQPMSKRTTSEKKNLRVILVKAPEQRAYENRELNLANNAIEKQQHQQQQQQQQQQAQYHIFKKQPNVKRFLQNQQPAHLTVGSGSQQQIPEVHFINYKTDAEADQVIEQVIQAYSEEIPNDDRISHVRVQALEAPVMKQLRKPAVSFTNNNAHPSLSVHKNYAMNYLPTGVDVVPGSSYIPLRRI